MNSRVYIGSGLSTGWAKVKTDLPLPVKANDFAFV